MAEEQNKTQLTEEDLMKSLAALEGKTEDKAKAQEPTVTTAALAKTAADTVKEGATEELKKALDVSGALSEFVALIGAHTDESLETLQKSINEAANRDLKMIAILADLKKSIDANTEAIKAFGQTTGDKPKTATDAGTTEVLKKNTGAGAINGGQKEDTEGVKPADVVAVMSNLAKSATTPEDRQRWVNATVTYEATHQIKKADGLVVAAELRKSGKLKSVA